MGSKTISTEFLNEDSLDAVSYSLKLHFNYFLGSQHQLVRKKNHVPLRGGRPCCSILGVWVIEKLDAPTQHPGNMELEIDISQLYGKKRARSQLSLPDPLTEDTPSALPINRRTPPRAKGVWSLLNTALLKTLINIL